MRLSMQCDSGGARARSEERALGLTPFSHFFSPLDLLYYVYSSCLGSLLAGPLLQTGLTDSAAAETGVRSAAVGGRSNARGVQLPRAGEGGPDAPGPGRVGVRR